VANYKTMSHQTINPPSEAGSPILPKEKTIEALETLIVSGANTIVLEGDNQKQAGLREKISKHGALNPHSTMIPESFPRSSRANCWR